MAVQKSNIKASIKVNGTGEHAADRPDNETLLKWYQLMHLCRLLDEKAANYLKLRFPEGEIDFVAAGWLTPSPFATSTVLDVEANLETSAEIIGKKVRYRADTFKARDLFDLAIVKEREPDQIEVIRPIIETYRHQIEERIRRNRDSLEEEYRELDLFDNALTLEQCVEQFRGI